MTVSAGSTGGRPSRFLEVQTNLLGGSEQGDLPSLGEGLPDSAAKVGGK